MAREFYCMKILPSLPFISVLIPNYNHADFLEQRIESVLNQTYPNFEVIILDDYSTDKSLEIINKFEKHPRVREIIINAKNSGSVFKQWVRGINKAEGKYFWIAESDDYADKLFLEETVKIAEENETAGLVFTDSYNVDTNANITGKVSTRHNLICSIEEHFYLFNDTFMAPRYFIDNMLILNASAVLFNLKKFKETVDLFELETFKNTGDQFSYLSLFLRHEIIYLNKPLNYRRIHEKNTTALNFLNGTIYRERIKIINYFFPILRSFPSSKVSFNNYLRQNFLKAMDFHIVKEMRNLLWKFFSTGCLSLTKYIYLNLYILVSPKFSKQSYPYKFRIKIKKVLTNL